MRRTAIRAIIPLVCLALVSCAEAPEKKTIYAMDTAVTITAYGKNAAEGTKSAEDEIYRIDKLMSRSNENGDIYLLNESGSRDVSVETASVIEMALEVCRSTGGAFDLTVTPLIDAWGFFGQNYRIPAPDEIERLQIRVGYENVSLAASRVTLENGVQIDLGGIAKGFAAGAAAEAMKKSGVKSGLISSGSTILAVGKKANGEKWNVGLANPKKPDEYIATLRLADECISTSGSYEQVFEQNGKKYHHIIDPSTGYPAESGLASVSVICDDPTLADALSTALFVMGLDRAAEYQKNNGGFEAVFVTDENEIYRTSGVEISVSEGFSVTEI